MSSLYAQELTLDTITVSSATKSEQSLKDVTSNVNVITSAEIEEKHYTTVAQALNSIAGVSFTSNGGIGSTTNIYLRGAGNSRTLVLVDGVRYQDPSSTSGANISHLMIENIEQIEVIKGAQSGIWGADASAGVINIITKKAKNGTHVSAYVEGGSFDTRKYGATASYKAEAFDIQISANKITSDSFTSQAPKDEILSQYEDDPYSNTALSLKAGYNFTDDARVSLSVTDIDALKDYDSYNAPDDDTMQSDVHNRLYNLTYTQKYSNHNFTLKAEKSEFSRDEIGTVSAGGYHFVKVFNGQHINYELSDNIKYNQNDFVVIGLGHNKDDVDYEKTDNSTKQKDNSDNYIYLTNSNKFADFILTQSLRYDDYNNFDSKLTGKIGAKYQLNQDIYFTSNIGIGYNVPNIMQELNPWGGPNSELNPENTQSFDISFAYKTFKATYFYNKITDLIEWYDPDGWGGTPAIYKNREGESIFKGVELEYSQNIIESIMLSLNYTHLTAQDKDGKELARRPKETLKATLDFYPIDALHLGLSGEYIGTRYDKFDKSGEQTGRYTLVNLSANYDVNQNFSLYTKVDNLFDTSYQIVDGYATAPLSAYLGLKAKF